MTQETKNKISNSMKGSFKGTPFWANHVSMTDEHKKRISKALQGKKMSDAARLKMSLAKKGKSSWNKGIKRYWKSITEFKPGHLLGKRFHKGHVPWNKGMKGFMAGEKNKNWKGGITPLLRKVRNAPEYAEWREEVFRRDNWTCQRCGLRGVYLEVHHLKRVADFMNLVYKLDNGVTLCLDCHVTVDKFRKKFIKSKK